MLKVSSCSVHELIFAKTGSKYKLPEQGPFVAMSLTMVWEALHDHHVPRCWEGSFPGLSKISLINRPLNVLLLV